MIGYELSLTLTSPSIHLGSYIVGCQGASQLGGSLLGIPPGYKASKLCMGHFWSFLFLSGHNFLFNEIQSWKMSFSLSLPESWSKCTTDQVCQNIGSTLAHARLLSWAKTCPNPTLKIHFWVSLFQNTKIKSCDAHLLFWSKLNMITHPLNLLHFVKIE